MVGSAGLIGRIIADFANAKHFARLQEIMALKTECQQIILKNVFLEKSKRMALEKALIEEKEILTIFRDEYVPNTRRMIAFLDKSEKRKGSAADRELIENLKKLLKLFIKYNKGGIIGELLKLFIKHNKGGDSIFLDVNKRQLYALKIGRFGSFSRVVDEQKNLEMDLYMELKNSGCEEKFDEYFKQLGKGTSRRKFLYLLAFAGVGALALLHEAKYKKIQGLAANYFGEDISEELERLLKALKAAGVDAKPHFVEGSAYVIIHVKMVHDTAYLLKDFKPYEKFEELLEAFVKTGTLQMRIKGVLERLASMGYTDVHAEATMDDQSVATCVNAKNAPAKALADIQILYKEIINQYNIYVRKFNVLRKKNKLQKEGKESEESVREAFRNFLFAKAKLCKMLSIAMLTSVDENSNMPAIKAEVMKIAVQSRKIKSLLENNREELENYAGGYLNLAASGAIKIRKTEDRAIHAARVREKDEAKRAILNNQAEFASLENMVAFMKANGKNVSIIVFGGVHEWEDNVREWNAAHPFSRIALVEVEVPGYADAVREKNKDMESILNEVNKSLGIKK